MLRYLVRLSAAGSVIAGLVVAGPAAFADSSPVNDSFSSPTVLSATTGSVSGSNAGATVQSGEPALLGHAAARSVWFSWTPTKSGRAVFRTEGSSFDTVLAAYTGSAVGSLTQVAVNDDASFSGTPLHQSRISFDAKAWTTYRIAVDGYSTASAGPLTLSWTSNDSFVAGMPVPGTWDGAAQTLVGSNDGATSEPGEPWIAGDAGGSSVWFNWTAPFTGTAFLDTDGSSFNTVLGVYTGTAVSALTTVASNDDENPLSNDSAVHFAAKAGQLYRIAISGIKLGNVPQVGDYQLTLAENPPFASVSGGSVKEGNPGDIVFLPFTVTLSKPSKSTVQIRYGTADGSAKAGLDYLPMIGTATLFPGQTSVTVNIQVVTDKVKEADETVLLQIVGVSGGETQEGIVVDSGVIKNDD